MGVAMWHDGPWLGKKAVGREIIDTERISV